MPAAIRLAVADVEICFTDAVQGRLCERVDEAVGDFVIYRKEQLPAYQLAVVIDDADQGITHIVRGSDLLDNTPRQILLQRTLQLRSPQPAPHYMHVPVIANAHGQKLSKQTYARALADDDAVANLCAALDFLGQTPPAAARRHVRDLLDAAIARWTPAQIPPVRQLSGAALPPSCRPFAA